MSGAFISSDLVGRELTHNAKRVITIQADPESDLIVPGGITYIQGNKLVRDVPNVKVLLYDSGAEHNEITFESKQWVRDFAVLLM